MGVPIGPPGVLTYAKKLENGRPLSFAKTHTRRDTDAKTLKRQTKRSTPMSAMSALVAGLEPVALYTT